MPSRRVRLASRYGVLTAWLWLLVGAVATCWAQPVDQLSAQALVDAASTQMRIDPEAGRRGLESALAILHRTPNADVEINAHLLLADYYLGRDQNAAQAQISAADELLVNATRPGWVAGVLNFRGKLLAMGGDSDQAALVYDQAAGVAESAHDEEMLAEVLLSRGLLRSIRGIYALSVCSSSTTCHCARWSHSTALVSPMTAWAMPRAPSIFSNIRSKDCTMPD